MVQTKKRRKLVFDQECTRAYSFLTGYPTLLDARAGVPQLARAMKISAKAVGGYLTQASTNPRVTEHMLSLGYTRAQIPAWFKWPDEPPTPHNEVPRSVTQPMLGTQKEMLFREFVRLHPPPNFSSGESKQEDREPWFKKGWPLPTIDASKIPPYAKIRILTGNEKPKLLGGSLSLSEEIDEMYEEWRREDYELYLEGKELRRRERELAHTSR